MLTENNILPAITSENILDIIYNNFNDQSVIKSIYDNNYNINLVVENEIIHYKFDTIQYQNSFDIYLYPTLKIGTSCNLYHLSRDNIDIYLHINRLAFICFNSNQLEGLMYCLKNGASVNYLLKYDQINSNINKAMYQLLSTYGGNFNLLSLNHLTNIINDTNDELFIFLVRNGLDLHKIKYLINVRIDNNIYFIEKLLNNDITLYDTSIINFIILQLLMIYYK